MSGEGERIAAIEAWKVMVEDRCKEARDLREKIFSAINSLRSRIDKFTGAMFVVCGIASVAGAVIGQLIAKHFGG